MKNLKFILFSFLIVNFAYSNQDRNDNNLQKTSIVVGPCDTLYTDTLNWCTSHGFTQCKAEEIACAVFLECKNQKKSVASLQNSIE